MRPFAKYNLYLIPIEFAQGDNQEVGLCRTHVIYFLTGSHLNNPGQWIAIAWKQSGVNKRTLNKASPVRCLNLWWFTKLGQTSLWWPIFHNPAKTNRDTGISVFLGFLFFGLFIPGLLPLMRLYPGLFICDPFRVKKEQWTEFCHRII